MFVYMRNSGVNLSEIGRWALKSSADHNKLDIQMYADSMKAGQFEIWEGEDPEYIGTALRLGWRYRANDRDIDFAMAYNMRRIYYIQVTCTKPKDDTVTVCFDYRLNPRPLVITLLNPQRAQYRRLVLFRRELRIWSGLNSTYASSVSLNVCPNTRRLMVRNNLKTLAPNKKDGRRSP